MGQATDKQQSFARAIAELLEKDLPEQITFESLRDFISNNNRAYYEKKNDLIRENIIQNVSILDYAKELGFTVIRKGRYYSLKEHDSVIIDTEKNCFWRNSEPGYGRSIGRGDSVIGFAEMFSGKSKQDVMKELSDRVSGTAPVTERKAISKQRVLQEGNKKEFVLPEASDNMRRVFAYLTKSRMIDPDIVQEMVNRKLLYQSKEKGNCVFVSRDASGNAVSACLRGTNTEHRFVGDVAGCDYEKGFYIDNHADQMIVAESYIDVMSIMTILKAQGMDIHAYNYMPLAGAAKFDCVCNYLEDNKKLLCAFDEDAGGHKNLDALKNLLKERKISVEITEHFPQNFKDWNEELQDGFRKMSVGKIDFFRNPDRPVAEQIAEVMQSEDPEKCRELAKKLYPDLPELQPGLQGEDFEAIMEKVTAEKIPVNDKVEKLSNFEKLWTRYSELKSPKKKELSATRRAMEKRAQLSGKKNHVKGIEL